MSGTANFVLDILIVVLLSVTIAYCWLLNRRIKVLQDSKSELAQLLHHFDESTQRASESIIALQTASKKIGENIQFRIDKANYLLDDLAFMTERGGKLVNQMEAGFAVTRAQSKVMAEPHVEVRLPEEPVPEKPAKVPEKHIDKHPEKHTTVRDKTSASLEAVLERVVGRGKGVVEDLKPPERPQQSRVRSKAEQELLEMIKAGIKG